MCKKNFIIFGVLLIGVAMVVSFINTPSKKNTIRIGILIPMEHAAIRDIVAGFQETVTTRFPSTVTFNVQSAEGDLKLQRGILELFVGQKMDLIVPIGTSATQMTLALVKEQHIVSLAAQYSEKQRQQRNPMNITGIGDEIGGQKKIDFIKNILPEIRHLTLIAHSGNEKNFEEIRELKERSLKLGIELQVILIQNLPELDLAARAISSSSGGLLILKDHLLASGIRMLVTLAKARGIPLIASDEGSVREGATFGLGVTERSIGSEGGKLAIKILEGQGIYDLPMQEIQNLSVFYRRSACEAQHIDLEKLQAFAKENRVELIQVDDQK